MATWSRISQQSLNIGREAEEVVERDQEARGVQFRWEGGTASFCQNVATLADFCRFSGR